MTWDGHAVGHYSNGKPAEQDRGQPFHHCQLQRRHELHQQQRQRTADGSPGEYDHDSDFFRQSGDIRSSDYVHCHGLRDQSSAGAPTGMVTFQDGSVTLDTEALDSTATATFSTSILTVGDHTITATYSGDANFNTSTSAGLDETVQQDARPMPVKQSVQTDQDTGQGDNSASHRRRRRSIDVQYFPPVAQRHGCSHWQPGHLHAGFGLPGGR